MKTIDKILIYLMLLTSLIFGSLLTYSFVNAVSVETNQSEIELKMKLEERIDSLLENRLSLSLLSVEKKNNLYLRLLSRLELLSIQNNSPNKALVIKLFKEIIEEKLESLNTDIDQLIGDILGDGDIIIDVGGLTFDKIEVDIFPNVSTKVQVKLNNQTIKEFTLNSKNPDDILTLIASELNTTVLEIKDLVVFRFRNAQNNNGTGVVNDNVDITVNGLTFDKIKVDVRPDRLTKVEIELNDVNVKEFRITARDRNQILNQIAFELNTTVSTIENKVLFRFRNLESSMDDSMDDSSSTSNSNFVERRVTMGGLTFDKIKVDVRPARLTKIEFELNDVNVRELRVDSRTRSELLTIIANNLGVGVSQIESLVLFRFRTDDNSNGGNSGSGNSGDDDNDGDNSGSGSSGSSGNDDNDGDNSGSGNSGDDDNDGDNSGSSGKSDDNSGSSNSGKGSSGDSDDDDD